MKTYVLVAGLACLSVVAVAQQSNSTDQKAKAPQAQLRESPSKASSARRVSPSMMADGVTAGDVNGDGKADKAGIGSQSSGSGAGIATSDAKSDTKSPRDLSTGQASGKVNVQDISIMKRSSAPAETKSPRDLSTGQASGKVNVQDISIMKKSSAPATDKK